jgi:hypothetical protein
MVGHPSKRSAADSPQDRPQLGQDHVAEPAAKRRGGAPKGNTNAAKDPKFTRAMREAIAVSKRNRRRRKAGHLATARAVVHETGLGRSPLGERIAVRLSDVESEIDELGRVVDRVGRVKRSGDLSPAYERRLALIGQDRVELRSLVDRLAEAAGAGGASCATLEEAHAAIERIVKAWPTALTKSVTFGMEQLSPGGDRRLPANPPGTGEPLPSPPVPRCTTSPAAAMPMPSPEPAAAPEPACEAHEWSCDCPSCVARLDDGNPLRTVRRCHVPGCVCVLCRADRESLSAFALGDA